jgi:hypothetical protein
MMMMMMMMMMTTTTTVTPDGDNNDDLVDNNNLIIGLCAFLCVLLNVSGWYGVCVGGWKMGITSFTLVLQPYKSMQMSFSVNGKPDHARPYKTLTDTIIIISEKELCH